MWMIELSEYLVGNPQIIVNGFVKAGITAALDRKQTEDTDEDTEDDVDYNTKVTLMRLKVIQMKWTVMYK